MENLNTARNDDATGSEWDNLAEDGEAVGLGQMLEDGMNPIEALDAALSDGTLELSDLDDYAGMLSLTDEQEEKYRKMILDSQKDPVAENIRRRADEEPETPGYETPLANQ